MQSRLKEERAGYVRVVNVEFLFVTVKLNKFVSRR
jgi:hypothetical protein